MCNSGQINIMGYVEIFDARPLLNARANKMVGGGGYEDCGPDGAYSNCKISFGDIDNIHVVRDSYEKIYDLAYNSISNERSKATGWNCMLDNTDHKYVLTRILTFTNDMLSIINIK